MTKHLYASKDGHFDIDTGWERGRQSFYLTIFQNGSTSYDSDNDQTAVFQGMDIELVEQRLSRFQLRLPEAVKAALLKDQRENAAPYIKRYRDEELYGAAEA